MLTKCEVTPNIFDPPTHKRTHGTRDNLFRKKSVFEKQTNK